MNEPTAREGIQELYGKYPIVIDANDEDALADCFLEDGVFEVSGEGYFKGSEQIKGLVRKSAEGRPRHYTANLWIKSVDGDEAECTAYFLLVDLVTGENCAYGHYRDQVVRCDDGKWRWRQRRVQFEWTSESYAAADRAKAIPLS